MPKATVSTQETQRFDLKSCEGGFVELRKLSYGEVLTRRQIATEISMRGGNRKDAKTTVELMAEETALFDFKKCIVDHNLEDDNGTKLDFRSKMALAILDPKIGTEIDTLIDGLNNFNPEGDSDLGNSPNGSQPVSS